MGQKKMPSHTPPLHERKTGDRIETLAGEKTLIEWRQEIDALDVELLRVLNQRAAIACEIAMIKVAFGLPAYDPERESQVLQKIAVLNPGPLDEQSVVAIFSSIIHETRRLGTQRMQEQSGI
jgi:chorismate mutase/prephenate dehydratase